MNFIRTMLVVTLASISTMTFADTTSSGATTNDQTNTSGSNTTITGGYSAENTTTYSSGSTNDTTSTTTNTTNNNNNSKVPVPTASAPGMSAYSQDICAVGKVSGEFHLWLSFDSGPYVSGDCLAGAVVFTCCQIWSSWLSCLRLRRIRLMVRPISH